jgi:lipoteichoic acid synthase
MNEKDLSISIPLYIVNGNVNHLSGWHGKCNQLDVYTTLLDIVGTQSTWKGFGHTLITNDYQDSLKPELWQMSEQMILGDYFKRYSLFR